MKTEQIMYCVVALILGMLMANMFKSVCGCKNVVEGVGKGRGKGRGKGKGGKGKGGKDTVSVNGRGNTVLQSRGNTTSGVSGESSMSSGIIKFK